MKFFLIIILLCSSFSAVADEWTDDDKYREAVYLTFHTIDWLQTRSLAKEGWKTMYETNIFLGKHPTTNQVDAYFALGALAHIAMSNYLSPEWRKAFQYVSIGVEGDAVAYNISIGVGIEF